MTSPAPTVAARTANSPPAEVGLFHRVALFALSITEEEDTVRSRRYAQRLAAGLGFSSQDQSRVATAVSEVTRRVVQSESDGHLELFLESGIAAEHFLVVRISCRPRQPTVDCEDWLTRDESKREIPTADSSGLDAARRMMDRFEIETIPGNGWALELAKLLPPERGLPDAAQLGRLVDEVLEEMGQDPLEELRRQNRALMSALAEVRERRAEAEHEARLREKVLGVVAHDLRGPLNAIHLNTELLAGRSDSPKAAKNTAAIRNSVATMERLIGDLLDVTSIESGSLSVELHPIDPAAPVEAAVDTCRPRATQRDVTLDLELDDLDSDPHPTVLADGQRLQQVLVNLITNAVDHSSAGAAVTVTARWEDGEIRFAVEDRGPGIAAEDVERVFQSFYRGANRSERGAGLGLAIARGLVEAHDANLRVDTEAGRGSVFYFTLPVAPPAENAETERREGMSQEDE